MARRVAVLAVGAVLLAASSGCRHPWFNRCSGTGSGSGSGCGTASGSGSGCRADSCFDPSAGMVVSGPTGVTPGALIPGTSVPLVPGSGGMGTPPNELPFPGGLDRIPPTSVPAVPPATRTPAGAEGLGALDGSRLVKPVGGK